MIIRCAEAMIQNGDSLLASPSKLRLQRLDQFSTRRHIDSLKTEDPNNLDSLQSLNSNLTTSNLISSPSTALRSVQSPNLCQWPLMQVNMKHVSLLSCY